MTTGKRTYHHGNLRDALLACAFRHLEAHGPEKLSLRALARDIGVSQTAPYRHFPDKECLLAAMATEGYLALKAFICEASQGIDRPDEALLVCGEAYIRYAVANPAKYKLMFGPMIQHPENHPELQEAAQQAFGALYAIIEKGIEQGIMVEQPVWLMANNCWANVHGHAMLLIDGLLQRVTPEAECFNIRNSLMINMHGRLR
ncbi:TetR/AcrR family transcriptional regulator [Kistimonas asteriae]|uniref:TetR/AcrR family transcriptional regulator n=1 Tax=Kistimonas asteriae TaxID=517724 RepID=UPI001BA4E3CB|nr:TetR/AcrR family transcriptional regulator [Kistimonas asteriae]